MTIVMLGGDTTGDSSQNTSTQQPPNQNQIVQQQQQGNQPGTGSPTTTKIVNKEDSALTSNTSAGVIHTSNADASTSTTTTTTATSISSMSSSTKLVVGTTSKTNTSPSSSGHNMTAYSDPSPTSNISGSSNMDGNSPMADKSLTSTTTDDSVVSMDIDTSEECPDFPTMELARLDEMLHRPRWVVPVLPRGELEVLLDAAIELCKRGVDTKSAECQRFFKEGLTISFNKILTEDAMDGWKFEIHRCIFVNAERLIELCVLKLSMDWFPLLDLLAIVFNPAAKFHCYNVARPSDTAPTGAQISDDELYARPPDLRSPRGWLVDLVNKFGSLNGFQILLNRFTKGPPLTVPVIAALIKPFGLCYEVLTPHTVQKYFLPIVDIVPKFIDGLTDDDLKKESKTEVKNETLSGIIKAMKYLVSRTPGQEELIKSLEIFRLKMILRLLQISSFNGKMNALNEVNKVIGNVSFYSHHHQRHLEEDEWLTAEKMAEWVAENTVLSIVLRDSLHQPQYVEKLEKIVRFMIKEKALTSSDLDKIWDAQVGKHEAIVKNVHDLLAKLAWDFSPEQLDHLFECFQKSWTNATKKQREKLLELIRRLAEDDKEGIMAYKVLGLLWNLAHSEEVPTDIMDQALAAHIKILDYSCSQDRDQQKVQWINRFVDELNNDKWVLPALKQIREICQLFTEAPQNYPHTQRTPHVYYRNQVINQLQSQHSFVMLIAQNLAVYMNKARAYAKEHKDHEPADIYHDGRFNHIQQVQERLKFLRFLLKDGQLWLCEPQAKQIWSCLAENAIYLSDRENCFRWFSKLMGEEQDLDPDITKEFFENQILQFDPSLLTENGISCFERFFKAVNQKESKLIVKRRGGMAMNDMELIGIDYLWRVVLYSPNDVAEKAIILLKETYTNLGPNLQTNQVMIHEDFLQTCMDRLRAAYDTISLLETDQDLQTRSKESQRMVRVLRALREYVAECDDAYGEDRSVLPLARACRGKHIGLIVRFPNQNRQGEDLDVWTHTNETVGAIRRYVTNRLKSNSNLKVDLYLNGEILDPSDDRKLTSQVPLHDKTVLTAKLLQVGSNMPSSPDSSSDSSTGSPHHNYDGPNSEMEHQLPGVIMSKDSQYSQYLFKVADLAGTLDNDTLRECSRSILKLMPADEGRVKRLRTVCATHTGDSVSSELRDMFFSSSPTEVLYHLEIAFALLMPAQEPLSNEAFEFQQNFVRSGGISLMIDMVKHNDFMSKACLSTRRSAYYMALRMLKLLLSAVGHAMIQRVVDALKQEHSPTKVSSASHNQAAILQQALHYIPHPNSECMTRQVALKLVTAALQCNNVQPDLEMVRILQRIAWASSSGSLSLLFTSTHQELHDAHERGGHIAPSTSSMSIASAAGLHQPDADDVMLCREALEVLTVCLALCPQTLDVLNKDKPWQMFITDLLLLTVNRNVRMAAHDQFFLIATKCTSGPRPLLFFITLLFTVLNSSAKEYSRQSTEYFQLLCRLLNYAHTHKNQISFPTAEKLLQNEISWLKEVRSDVMQEHSVQVPETLLEGHLGVTKELLAFQSPEKKYHLGSEPGGSNLIVELVEDFIFPASKIVIQCRKQHNEPLPSDKAIPVCNSSPTITAAFDLLVALCTNCLPNLNKLSEMLIEMYYSGHDAPLVEWEYLPPIGPRPHNGFVGLKNAGATCYMNSVLQQLFMIKQFSNYLLAVDGAADDFVEDDHDRLDLDNKDTEGDDHDGDEQKAGMSREDERKLYNRGVLKHVQAIFGHLACSRLQYYVPKGFWKHFRLIGEPVNLREQHDACEFFSSLVDSLDEAVKSLNKAPILSKVMGGLFADQKICKDCPHRYSREESFTLLNVDIRNHQNLNESLEQYVKGDLLEGANAYHCEKCNKKVDTVKRMCIKKLPPILAIQLKRFDYDWERECAIKFNDYFEFPREVDMGPYTVQGLAKIEGELISDDNEELDNKLQSETCTKYRLVGVVVHSGQASGGHYYSYILHRPQNQTPRWYKFDDGEVLECKMDDDEEMKNQCFGGEYLGEVFDHMLKRMSYRRQKRWWNAYILFYERLDAFQDSDEKDLSKHLQEITIVDEEKCVTVPSPKMPAAIERYVRKQNILFMHNKNQFSVEYFQFMRKLISCNASFVQPTPDNEPLSAESEQLAMTSMQLASKFLFSVGFHTKKTLRGPASEWYESLAVHIRCSKNVKLWFAEHILFANTGCFSEYLLECPSSEVRNTFMKLLVLLAHFARNEGSCPPSVLGPYQIEFSAAHNLATLSDYLLVAVLNLLRKEVSEHGRHLNQYFHLFLMYASLGIEEKEHLLRLSVPKRFMLVALDEGPGPAIKYQYAELGKLYALVSQLIRCCDVSNKCSSSRGADEPVLSNPYGDPDLNQPLMTLPTTVADILFNKPNYVKKLIEDSNNSEETVKLLRFCCWENPHFSLAVLGELLWQIAYSYTYELKPHLDLLLQMLMIEDSWQTHRILNSLKDDKDGLFHTIQRSKNHYQKRAYQCIKMMVSLFTHCQSAYQMLQTNNELKRNWNWAVEWLNDELDRRPYSSTTQYTYNSWSPPAQSNETANGYFLERSHSARLTLNKACELCPDEPEADDTDMADQQDHDTPQRDSPKSGNTISSTNSGPSPSSSSCTSGPAGSVTNTSLSSNTSGVGYTSTPTSVSGVVGVSSSLSTSSRLSSSTSHSDIPHTVDISSDNIGNVTGTGTSTSINSSVVDNGDHVPATVSSATEHSSPILDTPSSDVSVPSSSQSPGRTADTDNSINMSDINIDVSSKMRSGSGGQDDSETSEQVSTSNVNITVSKTYAGER